jgi:hypothetical protein
MGRRRAAAACSWLELGVAGRLRIPTQLGGDGHLGGCGGGLLLQQPAFEYRTPRALSPLICDLRTVGRLVDRCENTWKYVKIRKNMWMPVKRIYIFNIKSSSSIQLEASSIRRVFTSVLQDVPY